MIDYYNLIGVPFKSQGRTPEEGMDCWGLVRYVMSDIYDDLPEYYTDAFATDEINGHIESAAKSSMWTRLEEPEYGAVVTIAMNHGIVSHVGIYLGNGLFIHAREKVGVNIDRVDAINWKKRIKGYYKYNGERIKE